VSKNHRHNGVSDVCFLASVTYRTIEITIGTRDNNRYRDFGFLVLLHVVTRYSEQFLWQFARKIFLKERVRSRPVSLDGLQNKAVDVPECEGDRTLLICGARLVFRPLVFATSKQIRRSLSPHGNLSASRYLRVRHVADKCAAMSAQRLVSFSLLASPNLRAREAKLRRRVRVPRRTRRTSMPQPQPLPPLLS
jgi:hypothetical protein